QQLNEVADRLAPQPKTPHYRHRLLNSYTHNIGGLTEVKLVDIAGVILYKTIDLAILLDTRTDPTKIQH
ncbi:hypothetical protein, partial [Klebsiella pneumoniae]|uniref:hypothetical protein n=1 Tax=Klebsiella pneumoniae TaxID=573 RepID=UPI0025A03C83